MTEAVFGLLGVLLGGAITGWTTYAMERRQERATARVAARLVREDLLPATLLLEDLLTEGQEIGVSDLPPPEVWYSERTRLALVMSYSDYGSAAQAMYRYRQLRQWLASWSVESDVTDEQRSALHRWLEDMSLGLGALLTVAQDDATQGRRRRRPGAAGNR